MTDPPPLTPEAVERKLRWLDGAIAEAGKKLRELRDEEVRAKHEWERRRREVTLSSECPKVTRGGVTVADRDAWVDAQCGDLRFAYELASVARQAAEDHVRTLRDQAMIAMSLGKSVGAAYNMSGVFER